MEFRPSESVLMAAPFTSPTMRIIKPRRDSFTACQERAETETKSMVHSFERSLSPKFIMGKSVAFPKKLVSFKPLAFKIERKVLPPYTMNSSQADKSFNEQIKNLQVFKKSVKIKDTIGEMTPKPEVPGTIPKKEHGLPLKKVHKQPIIPVASVAKIEAPKIVDSVCESYSPISLHPSQTTADGETSPKEEAVRVSLVQIARNEKGREICIEMRSKSGLTKPILKKGINGNSSSPCRKNSGEESPKKSVSFSKYKSYLIYSPQV
jgi:hypothetical protein